VGNRCPSHPLTSSLTSDRHARHDVITISHTYGYREYGRPTEMKCTVHTPGRGRRRRLARTMRLPFNDFERRVAPHPDRHPRPPARPRSDRHDSPAPPPSSESAVDSEEGLAGPCTADSESDGRQLQSPVVVARFKLPEVSHFHVTCSELMLPAARPGALMIKFD
jgi:hypothetical protein